MNQNVSIFKKRLFFVYVVCSLIAVFYLPTLVPPPPSVSSSYIFGYNNNVGILLLLLLVTIGAIWTKGLNLQFFTSGKSRPVSMKVLAASLILVFCGCLAMYMLAGRFGGFGESTYPIDRTWLLSQGRIPYVDFEWPFGASFLYGPLLLQRQFSIGIVNACYLFWIFNYLLGTVLLFAVVNLIDYPTDSKRTIFLLIFFAGLPSIWGMGIYYTFLRYNCPLFFILVVHKLVNREDVKSKLYAGLLAIAFTITLLLISPETAIAHAFACVCIFVLASPRWSRVHLVTIAGVLLGFAVVFWEAMKLHVLDTARASGGGANSQPIAFAPHILLFFFALFVCACYVFRRFSEKRINDNTVALIAYSIPMIAAILGRCQGDHVFWNGEGVFLASMFYVSNRKTAWKWYRAAFIIIMILFQALIQTRVYAGSLIRLILTYPSESDNSSSIRRSFAYLGKEYFVATGKTSKEAEWEAMLARPGRHLDMTSQIDFASLYPSWHGTFLAPFGYRPNRIGTYHSERIELGFYEDVENAFTVAAIDRKLSEMRDHPQWALLLPDRFDDECRVDVRAERALLSEMFAFPYLGRAVHPEGVRQPICDYIKAHYRMEQTPTEDNFDYGLWVAMDSPR